MSKRPNNYMTLKQVELLLQYLYPEYYGVGNENAVQLATSIAYALVFTSWCKKRGINYIEEFYKYTTSESKDAILNSFDGALRRLYNLVGEETVTLLMYSTEIYFTSLTFMYDTFICQGDKKNVSNWDGILLALARNVYGYYRKSISDYTDITIETRPSAIKSVLEPQILYIANILMCLNVDELLKFDTDETYFEKLAFKVFDGTSSEIENKIFKNSITNGKDGNEIKIYDYSELKKASNIDNFGTSICARQALDYISCHTAYAFKVINEITNVILEYLPTIQADIAYLRTTYPNIPDSEEAKSLEKMLISNVGIINEDVNQTRDGINIANGTTAQQLVQRILTGSAWASSYKEYVNPVKYVEIADAIKKRIYKEVL